MKLTNPVQNGILKGWSEGHITQFFLENPHLYKSIGHPGHLGLDIVGSKGCPILACADGVVVEVKNYPKLGGLTLRIHTKPNENGDYYEANYGHLDEVLVAEGDEVKAGQVVAKMGNSGMVSSGGNIYWGDAPGNAGTHLHFGVRACSISPTGWTTYYSSGKSAYIKNYPTNMGHIDPMLLLGDEEEIKKQLTEKIKTLAYKIIGILKGRIEQYTKK